VKHGHGSTEKVVVLRGDRASAKKKKRWGTGSAALIATTTCGEKDRGLGGSNRSLR
jgi:hypothetical protein